MKLTARDTQASLTLSKEIFDYAFNEGLVHQAVVTLLNSARSGNSAQKTRAEVRGGGKKPWSQKGSGRARAGTIRSPLWRSGGVVFAAKKRDYSQKINKKMYNRAIRSILSELLRNERLIVLSDFQCESYKTKDFLKKMTELNLNSALIVKGELTENDYLASRNVPEFAVCDVTSIDPYSLLRFEHVVMTEEAIRMVEEQLL